MQSLDIAITCPVVATLLGTLLGRLDTDLNTIAVGLGILVAGVLQLVRDLLESLTNALSGRKSLPRPQICTRRVCAETRLFVFAPPFILQSVSSISVCISSSVVLCLRTDCFLLQYIVRALGLLP